MTLGDAPAYRSSQSFALTLPQLWCGGTERSASTINTMGVARWMDGEVVAPTDHGHTNGPWLMDQLWPVWADRPALWARVLAISPCQPGMRPRSLSEMESFVSVPGFTKGAGTNAIAVLTSLGLRELLRVNLASLNLACLNTLVRFSDQWLPDGNNSIFVDDVSIHVGHSACRGLFVLHQNHTGKYLQMMAGTEATSHRERRHPWSQQTHDTNLSWRERKARHTFVVFVWRRGRSACSSWFVDSL